MNTFKVAGEVWQQEISRSISCYDRAYDWSCVILLQILDSNIISNRMNELSQIFENYSWYTAWSFLVLGIACWIQYSVQYSSPEDDSVIIFKN